MNTKFFFSAIAMFAITSVANALPFGKHGKFPQVNEEVAASAVFKGVECKSGMELAARRGPHFPPYIVDTEKPMEVAIYNPLRH